MNGALYLYGVIPASTDVTFGRMGIGRDAPEVFAIVVGDVACVASAWEEDTVPATAPYAQGHEQVLLTVWERHPVVPFEFGTIAPEAGQVERLLRANRYRLRLALKKVDGKAEMQLIVSWRNMPQIFEDILKEHHAIARYRQQILKQSPEATYQDRIQIGGMVAQALGHKKTQAAQQLVKDLRHHVLELVHEEPIGDAVVLRAFCLVLKDQIGSFEQGLSSMDERFKGRFDWKYTGPLPCYHFAQVPMKL